MYESLHDKLRLIMQVPRASSHVDAQRALPV